MSFQFLEAKRNLLVFKQRFNSRSYVLWFVRYRTTSNFQLTFHHLYAQDKTILFSYFGLFALSEK